MKYVLFFLFFCSVCLAQTTHTLTTVTQSELTAKLADSAVVDGDTIQLPALTTAWTGTVTVTKSVHIKGAGAGNTIIYDHNKTGSGRLISFSAPGWSLSDITFRNGLRDTTATASTNLFTTTAHNLVINDPIKFISPVGGSPITTTPTYYVRTTPTANTFTISTTTGGAELDITTDLTSGQWDFQAAGSSGAEGAFAGGSASLTSKVYNCEFINLKKSYWQYYGLRGVFSNNYFEMGGSFRILMLSRTLGTSGDADWESPQSAGTADSLFFEHNTVTISTALSLSPNDSFGFIDTIQGGGRICVRFNTINKRRISFHGVDSSGRYRSGRQLEYYKNTFDANTPAPNLSIERAIELRGGTAMIWGNDFTGTFAPICDYTNYRAAGPFPPWGQADGTKRWDIPDLSDPGGTAGDVTAGDGIFETGTATAVADNTVTDSSKSWTSPEWNGSIVRQYANFTATSGGTNTLTVTPDPGWAVGGAGTTDDYWYKWEFTRLSDGAKGLVSGNTSNTITLSSNYASINMAGGGAFQLSYAGIVASHTATTFTTESQGGDIGPRINFHVGTPFEMRRLNLVMDTTGAGVSTPLSPRTDPKPQSQLIGQTISEPAYAWSNRLRATSGDTYAAVLGTSKIRGQKPQKQDVHYFNEVADFAGGSTGIKVGTRAEMDAITATKTGVGFWVTDQGEWDSTNGAIADGRLYRWSGSAWVLYYTPYTYPHPLVDSAPSVTSASVNGTTLLLVFNKSVTGVSAADFALSSSTLSAATGSGTSWTITVSPTTAYGATYTLNYTAGGVTDGTTPMASFSGLVPTNNNGIPSVRNPGRSNVKKGLF